MKQKTFLFSLVALIVTANMMVFVWFKWQEKEKLEGFVEAKASEVVSFIGRSFEERLLALDRMALRFIDRSHEEKQKWKRDARAYYENYVGFEALEWADPKMELQWIYPLVGNEKAVGRVLNKEGHRAQAIAEAIEGRSGRLSMPIELKRGGLGFLSIHPTFILTDGEPSEEVSGFIVAVYRAEEFFKQMLASTEYAVEVYMNKKKVFSSWTDGDLLEGLSVNRKNFSLRNIDLEVYVRPTEMLLGKGRRDNSITHWLFGFLFLSSLGLIYVLMRLQKSHDDLVESSEVLHANKIQMRVVNERLGLALEASEIGVWDFYLKENRLIWDDQMFEIYGVEKDRFLGAYEAWSNGLHPDDRERAIGEFQAAVEGRNVFNTQFRIVWPNHEVRHIRAIASVFKDDDGNVVRVLGVNWDISEQIHAEQELEKERMKTIQAAKMATLGEMAGGVAHEINNPLAVIKGNNDRFKKLLERESTLSEEQLERGIQNIDKSVLRMMAIVKGLRTFARDGSHEERKQIDLSNVVDDTLIFLESRCRNNDVRLTVEVEKGLLLSGREIQLSQALLNLLNNAYDAALSTSARTKRVSLIAKKLGRKAVIEVSDSGDGIPEHCRENLFEPFRTSKEVGKGTGLGLSITKGIIEGHGGTLIVSHYANPTTFEIRLPLLSAQEKPVKEAV